MASKESGVVEVGLWGAASGTEWKFENGSTITKIKLTIGDAINSIAFEYYEGGKTAWAGPYGVESGALRMIDLGINDRIKTVSGYYGHYNGYVVIRSLVIETTKKKYGPFGSETGTPFSVPVMSGEFVTFFGRADQWLGALGFGLKPF